MRNILLVVLCFSLVGCSIFTKSNKINQVKESLAEKDQEIADLQNLLGEKERQISEKDAKIEDLSKKLEMFGVFEK
ncbi:MAG: hypothetical protein PHS93_01965 [Candidatus Omnitrophica bacterium]|nr:hypothetical protein [Candidatus Omnitrophota bacterium]MDD5351919.1 hypothetical protein [Candidatus Omnitrophota bacterium]